MSLQENVLFYTGIVATSAAAGAYMFMDSDLLQGAQYGAGIGASAVITLFATSALYHIALDVLKISFALSGAAALAFTLTPPTWREKLAAASCTDFVDMLAPNHLNEAFENAFCR